MNAHPALRLVDTHCHLNLEEFDQDRVHVIERAREYGISRILIPGLDIETSQSAIAYAGQFNEVFAAVGVHPNSQVEWSAKTLSEIRSLAGEAKVVAIGEIGLDYYRQNTAHELQRTMFEKQLELAAELGLPVVIHNRDASEDILEILARWQQDLVNDSSPLADHPGVLHSFSASEQVARRAIEMGFKLGIDGPVTFKNAQSLQSIVMSMPLESLLIETDAPFLAPAPYRGKRNEPANVRIVAEKIAELRKAPVDVVANITTESADQLFDWRVVH